MNLFKNITKQAFILIVSEVLFVGLLSFGVNKYIFSFMQDWAWWQYSLMIIALAALVIVTLLLWQKVSYIIINRRSKQLERQVSDFQLSVMQEFFKIRMEQSYNDNWVVQVKNVVENKFASGDPYKHNYQGIHEVISNEGVETLDEKDMDITCITSLMLHDFFNQCKVGTNFRQQIRNIQTDKNRLVSHIPDHSDLLNVKILELTTIKNIRSFLKYLQNSTWSYSGKQEFIDKYQGQIEGITNHIFKEVVRDDQETIEFESNKRNYLVRLVGEKKENENEYIALSYKADDGSSLRYNLEDLFSLPDNSKGFVLFSKEAGYGKTWSIQELAGQCAENVLNAESEKKRTPILLRMGDLAVSGEPIVKAVQEILYPGNDSVEKARQFLRQESVILFIDGMDEADKNNKEPIRRELNKLLSSAKDIKIIGGTRESDRHYFPGELLGYSICDLSDKQVESFINRLIIDEKQREDAIKYYFKNPKTAFLKNLRSPFYLKCFIDFIKEGETAPESDTDMMNRCINKMIEREINLKGFRATVQLVNDYLAKLSELIGNEKRYVIEQEALKIINNDLLYDKENYANVVQIKDTLVELQILTEFINERQPVLLGFWHEKYKSLFSPVAIDTSLWDW